MLADLVVWILQAIGILSTATYRRIRANALALKGDGGQVMVTKFSTKCTTFSGILILMLPVIALAVQPWPLPTHPLVDYAHHYDPQNTTVEWLIPQGWAINGRRFTQGGSYDDNLNAPRTDWLWETLWYNPSGDPIELPIIFKAEGFGDNRFPRSGVLTLKAGVPVQFDNDLNESGLHPEYEVAEGFEYLMWAGPNLVGRPFRHDCAISEQRGQVQGLLQANDPPPEWQELPLNQVELMPHVVVLVRKIPPRSRRIPAVSHWGKIGMILVLLTTGVVGIAWQRQKVAT